MQKLLSAVDALKMLQEIGVDSIDSALLLLTYEIKDLQEELEKEL